MAIAFTVDAPRSYEANPGLISVQSRVPVDTLEVRVDGKRYRLIRFARPTRRPTVGPFGFPSRDITVTVAGFRNGKLVGRQTTSNVLGLPKASMTLQPITRTPRAAQARMQRLSRPASAAAAWTVNLATGRGASYNAGARFSAASTLKLPIMITLLIQERGDIVGSAAWGPLQSMIRGSSNDAANSVLELIGGSVEAGGAEVTGVAHQLGAIHTETAAGYLPGQDRRGLNPPVTVNEQSDVVCCKITTAHDLGVMMQSIVEAMAGRGRAYRLGLTRRDARVAIWLLAHARHPGFFAPWTPWVTAHKVGDVDRAWHDVAAIFNPKGTLITVVLTDNPNGASESAAADYGERVLRIAETGLNAPRVPNSPPAPVLMPQIYFPR